MADVKITDLNPVAQILGHYIFEMVNTDDPTHGPAGSSFSGRFDQIPTNPHSHPEYAPVDHDHDADYAPLVHGHLGNEITYDPTAVPSAAVTVQAALDDAAFSVPQIGTARVSNIMSCDQATYDGLAPVGDYLYVITD